MCAEFRVVFCSLPIVVSNKELLYSISSVDKVIVSENSLKCGLRLPLISVEFFRKTISIYDVFFYPCEVDVVGITSIKQKMELNINTALCCYRT